MQGKELLNMLDFYIIDDEQSKPSYPEEINLEYIGGLNDRTFEKLKTKGLIEERFDYYTDFRWNSDFVKLKYDSLLNHENQSYSDLRKLFGLVSKAKEIDCGLIAYCD